MNRPVGEGVLLAWPAVVGVITPEKRVAVSELDRLDKAILWQHLKMNHKTVSAELKALSEDLVFQRLQSEFDGTVLLPERYFPEELVRKLEHRLDN